MSEMPQLVKNGWEGFREAVMHPEASEIQVQEMRRAFYAGAWFMLTTFTVIGRDDVNEETGVHVLSDAKDEIEEFVEGETNEQGKA